MARLAGVEKVAVEAELLLGKKGGFGLETGMNGSGGGRRKGMASGLNRRVVIDEDRHCAVCHKRFGGSAIRVYPDNSVVHSGCMRGSVGRRTHTTSGGGGWR